MIETEVRDKRSKPLQGDTRNMSHFPFRGSPNNQNSSAPSSPTAPKTTATTTSSASAPQPPPPLPPHTMAVTSVASPAAAVITTVPPGARSVSPTTASSLPPPPQSSAGSAGSAGGTSGTTPGRCCDTGRLFADPITGQPVCSCQYEREAISSYQRLATMGGLAGPGGMPLSMYSSPYPEGMAAYFPALGADQAPFYPNPAAAGLDLKDNLTAGAAPWPPYPSVYHPYDAFAGYPFANGYGMDLNGARRKNATRETTSTLKAWLNEHKKNPYPTKGEKIMLAIITKMTLTQVSTWFANARRRLKKENKMTWEPRNRVEDDDVNLDDDDHKSNDEKDLLDSKDSGTGSSEDGDRPSRLDLLDRSQNPSDWSGSRNGSGPNSPDLVYDPRGGHPPHPLLHPAHFPPHLRPPMGVPPDSNHNTTPNPNKPRIWSLADMASKEGSNKDSDSPSAYSAGSSPGKMLSPLAARGLHPALHHPYMRHDLYRNFYGSAAAHLSDPHNVALLESYQRQLGAMAANGALPPGLIKAPGGGSFAPLSLTTTSHVHHQHQRALSPASSTSSSPGDREPPADKPTALVTTASKP